MSRVPHAGIRRLPDDLSGPPRPADVNNAIFTASDFWGSSNKYVSSGDLTTNRSGQQPKGMFIPRPGDMKGAVQVCMCCCAFVHLCQQIASTTYLPFAPGAIPVCAQLGYPSPLHHVSWCRASKGGALDVVHLVFGLPQVASNSHRAAAFAKYDPTSETLPKLKQITLVG